MYLYFFEHEEVKYLATAGMKVHPESTFTFTDAAFNTFTKQVKEHIKLIKIDSFNDLRRNRKILEREYGMRSYITRHTGPDGTLCKFVVFICGQMFINAELLYLEDTTKENDDKIFAIVKEQDLYDACDTFGIPRANLTPDLIAVYNRGKRGVK